MTPPIDTADAVMQEPVAVLHEIRDRKISMHIDVRDQFRPWLPGEEAEIKVVLTNNGDSIYHGQLALDAEGRFMLVRQHPPELKVFPQSWARSRSTGGDRGYEVLLTIRATQGAAAEVGTHAVLLHLSYSISSGSIAAPVASSAAPETASAPVAEPSLAEDKYVDASDWAQWTILPAPRVALGPMKSAAPRGHIKAYYAFSLFNPGNIPVEVSVKASEENAERMAANRRLRFRISRAGKQQPIASRIELAAEKTSRFGVEVRTWPRLFGGELARPYVVQVTQHEDDTAARVIKIEPAEAVFTQVSLLTPLRLLIAAIVVGLLYVLFKLPNPNAQEIVVSTQPQVVVAGNKPVIVTITLVGARAVKKVELWQVGLADTQTSLRTWSNGDAVNPIQYSNDDDKLNPFVTYIATKGFAEPQKFLVKVDYGTGFVSQKPFAIDLFNTEVKQHTLAINVAQPTPTATPTLSPTATPTPATPLPLPRILQFEIVPNLASIGMTVSVIYSATDATQCEIDGIGTLDKCDGTVSFKVDGPKTLTFSATNREGRAARKVLMLGLQPTLTPTPIVIRLGGLDLDLQYCGLFSGRAVPAGPGEVANAYSWKCQSGETYVTVEFDRACQMQYGVGAFARTTDANDSNSWACWGPKSSATPAPNP